MNIGTDHGLTDKGNCYGHHWVNLHSKIDFKHMSNKDFEQLTKTIVIVRICGGGTNFPLPPPQKIGCEFTPT